MIYYILKYKTVTNYIEHRKPHRSRHFEHIQKYVDNDKLAMGGAVGDPADEAFIMFYDEEAAEEFAVNDPYVLNGLVESWEIKRWNELVMDMVKKKNENNT